MKSLKKSFFFSCFICLCLMFYSMIAISSHRGGLHLQTDKGLFDLKRSDIDELQIFQTSKERASVMIRLKDDSATRLSNLTKKVLGQHVTWIWNGRVVSVEILQSPIEKDFTVHNFTVFEAEDVKNTL